MSSSRSSSEDDGGSWSESLSLVTWSHITCQSMIFNSDTVYIDGINMKLSFYILQIVAIKAMLHSSPEDGVSRIVSFCWKWKLLLAIRSRLVHANTAFSYGSCI